MYISFRLFRLERLQCTPNDTRVNEFPPKKQTPVILRAVVGFAQHPRLAPIVTLFQVMTKACDNVNVYCQEMSLTQ